VLAPERINRNQNQGEINARAKTMRCRLKEVEQWSGVGGHGIAAIRTGPLRPLLANLPIDPISKEE